MAKKIIYEDSRTLMEFRLLPGLTSFDTTIDKISLRTPLVYTPDDNEKYYINIPIVSAAMQSVSGERMGIELAKLGGLAFTFCSQSIKSQSEMVSKVKHHRAGFVEPIKISPDMKIGQMYEIRKETGYKTFPVVDENEVLLGMITKNDYDISLHRELKVTERMVSRDKIDLGVNITDLEEAYSLLIESHQSALPIVDDENRLLYLVFRKDIRDHLDNPLQVVDEKQRLLIGAAVNTHDFEQRVPALVGAGVDVIAVDSSDGHTFFQEKAIDWIKKNYSDVPVIGGNVITKEGFRFLVRAGAQAVKVGMGGGSICITQEQKGTGRGLATSIIKVVEERDKLYKENGMYIPIIADGGIVTAKDIVVALALGTDYVMMGRYFARMDESPTDRVFINNHVMKPYWGEGSKRAREWKAERYHQAVFAEGVEGFVEYAGRLRDNLEGTLSKIKSTMSTCGVANIKDLHKNAVLEVVSGLSIREGKPHDIHIPPTDGYSHYLSDNWE
ncbi:MAG: IMP dehydrogenase [Spirochaetota bacterium]